MPKRTLLTALIILCILSIVLPQNIVFAQSGWMPVAPGIDYQEFHLTNPRPVNIFVSRMDRNNPNVTIDSSIAQGRLANGTETVKGMASRYDEAINYWGNTWGNRNHVAAAINGYFFEDKTAPYGVPYSGVINSGWYAKHFTDTVGDAGFAWTLNREAFIGSCVINVPAANQIIFPGIAYDVNIDAINVVQSSENLIMYTPQFDTNTGTTSSSSDPVIEIVIELTRPTLVIPSPRYVTGYIREIHDKQGSTPIPFDHVVISAWGYTRSAIKSRIASGEIAIGNEIHITQEVSNCPSATQYDWTKTYAAIGGDYHFLNDGIIRTDFNNQESTVPNSRTAIAFNDNYIFFIVIDCYQKGVSEGMNIAELANFAKNTLGARWAISEDSGGSSTMVVNGEVKNNAIGNHDTICGRINAPNDLTNQIEPTATMMNFSDIGGPQNQGITQALNEPSVGTGMMMVVVEPIAQSVTFTPTQVITTVIPTDIRLGPGTNYGSLATVQAGTNGVILDHLTHLNGVLAKGSYWWKVLLNGIEGWVTEESLSGKKIPQPHSAFLPSITSNLNAALSSTAIQQNEPSNRPETNTYQPQRTR
jgi:hypothetical protein